MAVAVPAAAQDVDVEELDLPLHVSQEVVAFFGDPDATVMDGDFEVLGEELTVGPLAILEGTLTVAGLVEGDVMVINGNVLVTPGGQIDGDLTVIGGMLEGDAESVTGRVTVYRERYEFERVRRTDRRSPYGFQIDYEDRRWARSKLSIRSEVNYNRVEGLPVMVGPVFQSGRSVNTRFDGMAIYRTASGFRLDADEMGYFVRLEQNVGLSNRFTLTGTAHSLIEPIDRWRLDDFEASMGTLLLHRDYRDYYEREGFSLSGRLRVPAAGLFMNVEYRDEDHAFAAPIGDPWTLRNEDRRWRPQPLVAEGRLRSVSGELTVDDRNDSDNPSDGWYFSAQATFGLGGDLAVPEYLEAETRPTQLAAPSRVMGTDMRTGLFDLRRYTRLGPDSDFRIRGMWAGSLDDQPLPPQFQHALGGLGSLPGHDLLSLDCSARDREFSVASPSGDRTPVFPSYGCDRVAMFQAQYRGGFSVGWGSDGNDWADDWDWYPAVEFSPSWTVFFNAARGWTLSQPGDPGYFGPDTDTEMDAGAGFYIGGLGFYWAWPITGGDRNGTFFIRLEHRF